MKWYLRAPLVVLVAGLVAALGASAVTARTTAGPSNASKPTISGTDQVGSTLSANPGTWNGSTPINYQYQWQSCGGGGGNCHNISGATGQTYVVGTAQSGNTIRVHVIASNSDGSASATSNATKVVAAASQPPPTGCPNLAAGVTSADVASVAAPARLQIDQFVPSGTITRSMSSFTMRFHVSDTCGQPVSGAAVYATAVPFNQVTIPAETQTDGSGYVTLTFNRLSGFPAAAHQELLAMYVRARAPGASPLTGISTSRLISLRVNLNS